MEREVAIRTAGATDLDALLALEQASPEAVVWTRADYERWLIPVGAGEDGPVGIFRVAVDPRGASVLGFLLARTVVDEMEVLNLAVLPEARRQGVGRALLASARASAAQRGARRCWLEVRVSNLGALAFYRSQGFAEQYRRPRYYRNPDEDAVVCVGAVVTRSAAS